MVEELISLASGVDEKVDLCVGGSDGSSIFPYGYVGAEELV